LSPQRRKSDPAYIEGLEEGKLFNTVTKEIYGDTLEVVLLFFFKNRIKFLPIDEGGGIDCISANGVSDGRISPDSCSACKFSAWGNGEKNGNDAPSCTLYHNYMSFIPVSGTPLVISYKATGLKLSKQLLANIRLVQLPMYAKKYTVIVVEMRDGQNTWFDKKLIPGEFVDPKLFQEMENNFNALHKMSINVDMTGEAGDTSFEANSTEL
jgi:hypothetical protein